MKSTLRVWARLQRKEPASVHAKHAWDRGATCRQRSELGPRPPAQNPPSASYGRVTPRRSRAGAAARSGGESGRRVGSRRPGQAALVQRDQAAGRVGSGH